MGVRYLQGKPMDLAQLRRLLDCEELLKALEPHRGRDERIGEWIDRLGHQRGGIEDSGARGLDRALGVLLDGVAMRGSLRSCPEALRLEDVLDTNGLVLLLELLKPITVADDRRGDDDDDGNERDDDDHHAVDNHYEELAHLLRWLKIDRFDRRAANRELARVATERAA
jgi:hypothetical protein